MELSTIVGPRVENQNQKFAFCTGIERERRGDRENQFDDGLGKGERLPKILRVLAIM